MIFVTVGTQLPFDRLIGAMQDHAAQSDEPVVAQTGHLPPGDPWPALEAHATLPPERFAELMRAARIVVGHAGIGTVLSAAEHDRPLVVLPRRADLGEHRNDHQLATARRLEGRAGLHVAWETGALGAILSDPTAAGQSVADGVPRPSSRAVFLDALAGLIRK